MSDEPSAIATLLGLPSDFDASTPREVTPDVRLLGRRDEGGRVTVVDGGRTATDLENSDVTLAVARGPCYLALHTLARRSRPAVDGIVLVAEAKRALTRRDVADVCGVPVVATVLATNALARTIDAGLLLSRLHHLTEFRSLRRYAANLLVARDDRARTVTTSLAPPQHSRHETALKTVTDLPVALSATGRACTTASRADVTDGVEQSGAAEFGDGGSTLRLCFGRRPALPTAAIATVRDAAPYGTRH